MVWSIHTRGWADDYPGYCQMRPKALLHTESLLIRLALVFYRHYIILQQRCQIYL